MKYYFIVLLLSITPRLFAQHEVSGKVTDADGIPLGGVNISVPRTSLGSVTDFDGFYTIQATSAQDSLTFSYIGFKTQTIPIAGKNQLNVVLSEDTEQLKEVVVTALGIKKETKALGYAVQEVQGASLEKAKEPNFISALSGKVAGLNIKNSTDLFQNPEISLRGESPLLVIDGIPDRTTDLWKVNADDIESISVLKGATASALYGSVGRNGAIMITTKKGKEGKITVNFNNSTMFQPSFIRVPKVQTTYGNGDNGNYAYVNGGGGGSEGGGWIWGPKLDQPDPSTPSGYMETPQYNSPINPETGERIPIPYISRGKNNIENFFRTGLVQTNNLSIDWGNDKANYRISLSNVYQKGIVPNTDLNNTSFSIGGTITPSDKFKVASTLTYNKQYTNNFPAVGYGPTNYLYNLVLWTGTDVDVRDLRNYWKEEQEGYQQRHYNTSWYNNPYFQAYEYLQGYDKDNLFGNLAAEYRLLPEITLKARAGANVYGLQRTYKEPKSYVGYNEKSLGNFTVQNTNYFDITTDFGIRFEKDLTENISLSGEAAYSGYYRIQNFHSTSTDGLNVPGFYNLDNNAGTTLIGENREEKEAIHSIYGFVDLGFYDAFYLSITARNDKVSTLAKGYNSFFYPSVSGSVVVSNLTEMPDWISFAKIRGSWSRVSDGKIEDIDGLNANNPYNYIQAYDKGQPWSNAEGIRYPSSQYGRLLISDALKPKTSDSWEIGTDIRFFRNRLGIDIAYYQAKDYNNLENIPISDASGYQGYLLNGNVYKRKGIEFTVNATPVRNENFRWDTQVNFSQYRRYIDEIYGDKEYTEDRLKAGDRTDKLNNVSVYQTDGLGNIIYENGFPVTDPYGRYVGYTEPDWTYGFSNTFNYKNFTLSVLFDGRIGGLMYSSTNQKMWWGGISPGTVNQYRDDANNGESTYTGQGVKVVSGDVTYDSNGNITGDTRQYAPNDIPVNYISFMKTTSNAHNENYHYYSQTFIKLRELSLTYNVPETLVAKTPFNAMSVSFVGRNLWLSSKIPNVDPDPGKDNLQAPSTRSLGFNFNLKF
ncbi:SusC/RagA family TonB-linked outer membrane protein [Sinomicrobium pectinilyticum]|uniref:SusC/RagA family TonB-linked outer membrane protein n=1 Tax=Sinomicrobium pectinilyticum TaxID=1084421 RepID=A0A3N0EDQ1_SINP1|nr:SusC/RagA family TonB-linked outer membrane protein [Sinomicrobium pectinilyticum]RNL85975.1 SusC/RagA family TonB-linked outer membrane protein [Sinomicrobium pectinilyticum]